MDQKSHNLNQGCIYYSILLKRLFDLFYLNPHHLLTLQLLERFVQHSRLFPAAHACVDRVPITETLWQAALQPCSAT